jgi:hypothetical protein
MDANVNLAVQTLKKLQQDVMEVLIAIPQLFLESVMALHALVVVLLLSVVLNLMSLAQEGMTP